MAKKGGVFVLVRYLKAETNTPIDLYKVVCDGSHALPYCVPRLKQWLRAEGHEDLANRIPDYHKRGETGRKEWSDYIASLPENAQMPTGVASNDVGSNGSGHAGGGGGGGDHRADQDEGDGGGEQPGADGARGPAHSVEKRPRESIDEKAPPRFLLQCIAMTRSQLESLQHGLCCTPANSPEEEQGDMLQISAAAARALLEKLHKMLLRTPAESPEEKICLDVLCNNLDSSFRNLESFQQVQHLYTPAKMLQASIAASISQLQSFEPVGKRMCMRWEPALLLSDLVSCISDSQLTPGENQPSCSNSDNVKSKDPEDELSGILHDNNLNTGNESPVHDDSSDGK